MSLDKYWPTSTEVNECIKPEAEGVHDAILLAVHQPSPLAYRLVNSDNKITTTEDDLFNYFVTEDVPTGAHVVPITGASGVGKSHMIRLLAARLQGANNADRYLVIRIPKSASLRRVVELILNPLPDSQYATVKHAFKNALAEVEMETAVIRFQASLDIALKNLAKDLREKLHSNPTDGTIKDQIGHAERVPLLLSDAVTVDYFRTQVLPKIVKRAVAGQVTETTEPTQNEFTSKDLDLPDSIRLGDASRTVQSYYKSVLQAREGQGKVEAAKVLNNVIDQATREVFQLNEALGGMTLQDVILEIRRLLLRDNKDLVLLVEDFAALTGIQETLLKVLIQEGVRDGVKQIATMRSAIAITDGYLAGRETIATRAMREWIVESHLNSDIEVLQHTKGLVASYLNAARWGHSELIRRYGSRTTAWAEGKLRIDIFKDGEGDNTLLDPFKYEKEIPLFPFTDLAIESLARSALTKNNVLIFNPRFIINDVIRKILLLGRDAFLDNRFPPPSIEVQRPSTDVAQWLASLNVSPDRRERYQRVVAIWGSNPQSRSEIGRIPAKVFLAFGLESPKIEPSADLVSPQQIEQSPSPLPSSSSENEVRRLQVKTLQQRLEDWVQKDTTLDQEVANLIRTEIATALNHRIDWNSERCLKVEIRPNQVSIPKAKGEGRVLETAIEITSERHDPNGRLRAELISLLRFHIVFKKDANYAEVDDDLAHIGNLLDRLLPQALDLVRSIIQKKLRASTLLLAANSRLLGLAERGRTAGAIWQFLFTKPKTHEQIPEYAGEVFKEWRMMQAEALRIRPQLLSLTYATCGAFQGLGEKIHGIDITGLVESYPSAVDRLELTSLELSPELRQSLSNLSDARVTARTRRVVEELILIRNHLESQFGKVFNKNEIADSLKDLTEKLREMGIWNEGVIGLSPKAFLNLCEDFRSAALKEALDLLQLIEDGENEGKAVIRVAQLNLGPILVAKYFVDHAIKVVRAAEQCADVLETQYQGVDPAGQVKAINEVFDELLTDIILLRGD